MLKEPSSPGMQDMTEPRFQKSNARSKSPKRNNSRSNSPMKKAESQN